MVTSFWFRVCNCKHIIPILTFIFYRWTSNFHAVIVTAGGIAIVIAVTAYYPVEEYTTFVCIQTYPYINAIFVLKLKMFLGFSRNSQTLIYFVKK